MKIGFIGVGNMGGTLAKLAVGAEKLVSSRTMEKAAAFAEQNGCTALSNTELAARADMIFLGSSRRRWRACLRKLPRCWQSGRIGLCWFPWQRD